MKLSKQVINSFKEVWKYEFKEELSDIQAEKFAKMVISSVILLSNSRPSQDDLDME